MAAELSLLSLTQLRKLAESTQYQQQQQEVNPSLTGGSWMWNSKQTQEEDDSWEVKAFAEDTGNIMGTTWPPRSYTCTFCRREFRSAQALGGHMNVHRRDRARLHQAQPGSINNPNSSSSTSSSTLIIPTQEFTTNGGLCLLYQLPNPNGVFNPTMINSPSIDSPSTLLSISPYLPTNMISSCPPFISNSQVTPSSNDSSLSHPTKAEISQPADNNNNNIKYKKDFAVEELDLELRLGHSP